MEARKRAGLTQIKLAQRAGIGRDHYGRVERDEETPSDALADKLAEIVDLDPWEIKPEYQGPTGAERDVLYRLRHIERQRRKALLPMLLAMLDEASRSSAA